MPQSQIDSVNIDDLINPEIHLNGSSSNGELANDKELAVPNLLNTKKATRKEYTRKNSNTATAGNGEEEDIPVSLKISKRLYYRLQVLKDSCDENCIENLINKIVKAKVKAIDTVMNNSDIVKELKQLPE